MAMMKSPLPDLKRMQQTMDENLRGQQEGSVMTEPTLWQPSVDIWETDTEMILLMDLPGVDQRQIDVQIDDHTLVVRGERQAVIIEGAEMQRQERPTGPFEKRFSLPETIELGRVRAHCEQGVLKIRLPKGDDQQVLHITVEAQD